MQNALISQIITHFSDSLLLPDGSYVVQRSPQEIEVWGANISEHYTLRVEDIDDAKMDVVYLGLH